MAITADQKKKIAKKLAAEFGASTVDVTGTQLEQAVQDMDDWIEANQAAMAAEFSDSGFLSSVPAHIPNLAFVLTVMERNGKL